MIKRPLFPCRLVDRDIVSPDGVLIAKVSPILHPNHAARIVEILNEADTKETEPEPSHLLPWVVPSSSTS